MIQFDFVKTILNAVNCNHFLTIDYTQMAIQAENMILHRDEIYSRPKRTWFATEKDKKLVAKSVKVLLFFSPETSYALADCSNIYPRFAICMNSISMHLLECHNRSTFTLAASFYPMVAA